MNVEPAPITTTALTAGSCAAVSMESRMPSGTPGLSAFTGGLSMATTAMSSKRVSFTSLLMNFSCQEFDLPAFDLQRRQQAAAVHHQSLARHKRRPVAGQQ